MQVIQSKAPRNLQEMPAPPPRRPTLEEITEAPKENLDTIEEAPRRGRGRPPKHPVEAGTPRPIAPQNSGKTTFPRPTGGTTQKKFENFISYWQGLTPNMCSRARIHVYRKWPVIDRKLSGEKNQSIAIFQEDPALGTKGSCHYELDGWQQQVLHEFGSGDYKYIMNELGVTGAIAICDFVTVRDVMMPPKLNYIELDKGDKMNADYIRGLRERGIKLPGDMGYESKEDKEDEEVAQAQQTIDRLTDKLITLADRPQPVAPQPRVTHEEQTASKGLDIFGQLLKTSQELQGKQVNPIEMLTTLGGVMKEIMPQKEDNNPLIGLLMQQNQRAEERNDAMQRELRDREERKTKEEREYREREAERHAKEEERREREYKERIEREKPKTLLEQLREKNEIDELLGNKKKGKDEDEKEEKETMVEKIITYMPLVVSGLTTLATLGANIVYNMRVKPGEAPQPVPTAAAAATQHQAQTALTGVSAEQQAQQEQLNLFLQQIEQPFLAHFFGIDLNGYTFAEHIVNGSMQGPMIYANMKGNGKDALLQVLSGYPPIWQKVGGLLPKLNTFADEFMNYEEYKAQLLNEDDEEEDDKETVKVN